MAGRLWWWLVDKVPRLGALVAERDRYREALNEIADGGCTYRFHEGPLEEWDIECPGDACWAKWALNTVLPVVGEANIGAD